MRNACTSQRIYGMEPKLLSLEFRQWKIAWYTDSDVSDHYARLYRLKAVSNQT